VTSAASGGVRSPRHGAERAGFAVLSQVGSCVRSRFLCCAAMDESLQGDVGIALESPGQKTRDFMV
jgi:hypothetical protein